MRHRLWHRIFAAVCGLWLTDSLTEPAALQSCAMHSAHGPRVVAPGPLEGHVLAARLVTSSGLVLREFAVEPGNVHQFILVPTEYVKSAVAFQSLREEFLAADVLIELTTDLPRAERLRVALALKTASDFSRPHCD